MLLKVTFVVFVAFTVNATPTCKVGKYDFSPMLGMKPWIVDTVFEGTHYHFRISLCKALSGLTEPECKSNVAICRKTNDSVTENVGSFVSTYSGAQVTEDSETGTLRLSLTGQKCAQIPSKTLKTFIAFKCGKTLGPVEFLNSYGCETYFEWYTTVACKSPPTAQKEVRCDVFDHKQRRHNFYPLMKLKGAYNVAQGFYINVCRDITPDVYTQSCPKGTAACRIKNGIVEDVGRPSDGVIRTQNDKFSIEYLAASKPVGCAQTPRTTIKFSCPARGGSKDPVLVSDLNCHYEIEWVTEHACAEETLTSKDCKLSMAQHGVEIDLTPLKKPQVTSSRYNAWGPNKTYHYYLNVCNDAGIPCPDNTNKFGLAVCQLKKNDYTFGKSLGLTSRRILRYADGDLTLTYKDGDKCKDNFLRQTVINFRCNATAGKGGPVFRMEDTTGCVYIFDWDTKFACLPTKCRVDVGNKRYDLSPLSRVKSGKNWVAVDSAEKTSHRDQYLVNVCDPVVANGSAKGCPPDASICLKAGDGKVKSLGRYTNDPTYDSSSQTLKLHYTDGTSCGRGKTIQSYITFICKPGDTDSAPSLIRRSDDGCTYHFDWHTASACVLAKATGSNCRVQDKDTGISFDLSPLTKKTGASPGFYKIVSKTTDHDYYINICAPVSGTKCDAGAHANAGICQVDRYTPSIVYNAGKPSSILNYFDGIITLKYINGDPYRTTPPVPRQSELTFQCDPSGRVGNPEFLIESNFTYSFMWKTKYACPTLPVECVVTDPKTQKQYDLSVLSRSAAHDNWVAPASGHNYYINVCRPVTPMKTATDCDNNAAACQTQVVNNKETVSIKNIGQAKSKPTVTAEGKILIEYADGMPCTDNGVKKNYTTKLHLECVKGKENSSPTFLKQVGSCEFSFVWKTYAACPLEEDQKSDYGNCSIKDKDSDYMFNLEPLTKKGTAAFYEVESLDHTKYRINVCGPVSGCPKMGNSEGAVCMADNKGGFSTLATMNRHLTYSDDGRLTLTYPGVRLPSGDLTQVVITFICDKTQPLGTPKFARKDGFKHFFNFQTSLACQPHPVQCEVTDQKGNLYDLSSLARTDGNNWTPLDTRPEHKDLKYYINVCRPISAIPGVTCPGGAVGGCQVDGFHHAYNIGYIQSKPQAAADGSLTLRYLGGTKCHPGQSTESHRSTRINFICSNIEREPVFVDETSECEYLFQWQTKAACPRKRISGNNCQVKDPIYNHVFSLMPLHMGGTKDYRPSAGEYKFLINVCGAINSGTGACDGKLGVGSCQTKASTNLIINAGMFNQKLIYDDGVAKLIYTDGKGNCHGKSNRTTVLTFMCDHKKYGTQGPTYIKETSDCTYLFEWATSHMCMPFEIADCHYRDNRGNQYDLSRLTQGSRNYEYLTEKTKYVLNVCTTLVHTKGTTCPPGAAACKISLNETDSTKKFVSLGKIQQKVLTMEAGQIVLTYKDGSTCSNGQKASTAIRFQCNKDAFDKEPVLLFSESDCKYVFYWVTSKACPINKDESTGGNCSIVNRATGHKFDMSSLKKPQGYLVTDGRSDAHRYKINVCAPVADGVCAAQSGACQEELSGEKRHWNSGNANGKLQYEDGILSLHYSGGEVCHHNKVPRNTIITFVCNPDAGNGAPEYIGDSDGCTYYFSWHTKLACEKQVVCAVDNGKSSYDLSGLIKSTGHHFAIDNVMGSTDKHAQYYISICRPLNPVKNTLCPAEAAACRIVPGQSPQSLGRVNTGPTIDPVSGKVMLIYDHGVKCSSNSAKNTSTKIVFECLPGPSQGQPRLEDISDCVYTFSWATNVVCASTGPKITTKCKYTNPKTLQTYDLSTLAKANTGQGYQVTSKQGTYYINVCGAVGGQVSQKTSCSNAAVCHVDKSGKAVSYGQAGHEVMQMEGTNLKLKYENGADCPKKKGEKYTAYILFGCSRQVNDNGEPVLFVESGGCSIVFKWDTPLMCPPITEECAFSLGGATYDLAPLSHSRSLWSVKDKSGAEYRINLCESIHDQNNGCSKNSAVCRKAADGSVISLGDVTTQSVQLDSDGKTLVVQYSGGNNNCPVKSARRRRDIGASTVIKLTCGDTFGKPQFVKVVSDDQQCTFEFHWKTYAACKVARQPVKEENGIIHDPETGADINLNVLNEDRYSSHSTAEILDSGVTFIYMLRLDGKMKTDPLHPASKACEGASVCQNVLNNASYYKKLGDFSTRKFYMEDGVLEAVFTSDTECESKRGATTTTIVDLHCANTVKYVYEPVFTAKSKSCHYLFDWYTPVVCVSPQIKPETLAVGSRAHTVVTIISVFAVVILVSVLLIVFHKRERRAACGRKVRSLFGRGRGPMRLQYSLLSEDDEFDNMLSTEIGADEEDEQRKRAKEEADERKEILTGAKRTGNIQSYHDDSDDDMLL